MSALPENDKTKALRNAHAKSTTKQAPILVIAIIALILSIVLSTLALYNQHSQHSQLKGNLAVLNTIKKQYQNNQIEILSDVKALSLNYTNQQQQLQTLNLNLNNAISHNTQSQRFRVVNHSIYLIHKAQLQLNFNLATQRSWKLLNEAQHDLADLHDDSLFSLQHNLNVAIALLKSSSPINIPSMLQQLNQASKTLRTLSFIPTKFTRDSTNKQTSAHHLSIANRLAADFKDLVVIRHRQFQTQVIPSSSESRLAKINIQTKMSIAQWALLHRQKQLFQKNLIDASNLISTLFNRSSLSQKISRTLQKLASINIHPTLPDLNLTLHLANIAISPQVTSAPKTKKKTRQHTNPMAASPKLGAALS